MNCHSPIRVSVAGALIALTVAGSGVVGATPTTTHPTTTPPTSAPTLSPGTPFTVQLEVGNEPSLVLTAMLPPSAKHPWLLVGDFRSAPGAPKEIAVYAADGSGTQWATVATSGAAGPPSIGDDVATTPAGDEVIFGHIDTETGPRPAWWTFDGAALSAPTTIDTSEVPGRAIGAAVGADGSFVVLIDRYQPSAETTPEVVRRSTDGTWTVSQVEGLASSSTVNGVAILGSTVVVTGSETVDEVEATAAWVSIDGGATFTRADTSAFASTTSDDRSLGAVIAGGDGFYAATCMGTTNGRLHRYAWSADGVTWSDYDFDSGSPHVLIERGQCWQIALDPEGGVWLHTTSGGASYAFRVSGDDITEMYAMDSEGSIGEPPAVAVSGDLVAMAEPVRGGVAAAIAGRSDSWASGGGAVELVAADGVPAFRESFDQFFEVDPAGSFVSVMTSPFLAVFPNGLEISGPRSFVQTVNADGTLVGDESVLGPPPPQALAGLLAPTASGDVAVWVTTDEVIPTVMPGGSATGGSIATRLTGLGEHLSRSSSYPAGKPSPTWCRTAVPFSSSESTTESGTRQFNDRWWYIDGSTTQGIDVPFEGVVNAGLDHICSLGSSSVVAFGHRDGQSGPLEGEGALVVIVDTATLIATVVPPDPALAGVDGCASAGEAALVAATIDGTQGLFTTLDGVTFTPVTAAQPGDEVVHLDEGPAGIAVVGTTGPGGDDGFVMFGPTPEQLQRVAAPGLAGPGEQQAHLVLVRQTELLVFGTDDDAPTVWPIAIS